MSEHTFPIAGKYRFGWWMVLALVVLFVFGMVTGLTDSIWRLSPNWLIPLGLLGIASGWCLGGSRHKTGLVFILGVLSGLFLIILIYSGMYQDLYRAFQETIRIRIHLSHPSEYLPNAGLFFYNLYSSLSKLNAYWTQTTRWLIGVLFDQGTVNQLGVNLIWGSLLWTVLYVMGWFLRRKKHTLIASLPGLILVSTVTGYTQQETLGLIISLSAILGLIVLIEHLQRESRWENQKIDFSEELRFDIITITIPTVVLIMITAALIPQISLDNIRSFFDLQDRFVTDSPANLSQSLGLDRAALDTLAGSASPGMPRSHLIGSGPELAETKIMEVETGEFYLPPQVDPLTRLPKYYWYGRSYDIYTGSGWTTLEIRQEFIPADQLILVEENPYVNSVLHTIRKTTDAPPTLYFSGLLSAVDQNLTAAWHENTGEFFAAQLTSAEYQVNSYVYEITEEQLRQAQGSPPEIILESYLQLPEGLPDRVKELAARITAQAQTPYEQARAIETFLRQYEYTLDLPAPPQDRDLVDYFLFDLQTGYCDYFASAMVILARASGVPSRLVVGYAPGNYDYNRQAFIITEANAHAWPEIYLAPIGWVPFEPTASLTTHNWSPGTAFQPPEIPTLPVAEQTPEPAPGWPIILSIGILISLIALVVLLMSTLLKRGRQQAQTTVLIEDIYQKMRRDLTQLFFPLQTEHTHLEFCQAYTIFLQRIKIPRFIQKTKDQIIEQLTFITFLYEIGIYSPKWLTYTQVKQARHSLFNLKVRAWFLRVIIIFGNQ